MNTLLDHDNIAYGIYAGCLEILLVIGLYGVSQLMDEQYPLFVAFLIYCLPVVLLGVFIKFSMTKLYRKDKNVSGYDLFATGYTTGIVATFVFSAIYFFSTLLSVFIEIGSENVLTSVFKVTYDSTIVIGAGVIISILVSYFLYFVLSHFRGITYPNTYRRLPAGEDDKPVKKKKKSKKTSPKKKKKS